MIVVVGFLCGVLQKKKKRKKIYIHFIHGSADLMPIISKCWAIAQV